MSNNRQPRAKKNNTARTEKPIAKYPELIEENLDHHTSVKRRMFGLIQEISTGSNRKYRISETRLEYVYEVYSYRRFLNLFKWMISYSIDKNQYEDPIAVAQ